MPAQPDEWTLQMIIKPQLSSVLDDNNNELSRECEGKLEGEKKSELTHRIPLSLCGTFFSLAIEEFNI